MKTAMPFLPLPIHAPANLLLQSGDRMNRLEFERRYAKMPNVKAELIEGVVYVASPVKFDWHREPHYNVIGWLNTFSMHTPGIRGGDNGTLRLDEWNEPQPDAFLMIDPECGGQAKIDSEKYLCTAPELIVEVAASSANYDLHDKLKVYCRHGVKEYIVWRVVDQAIDWFVLRGKKYKPQKLNADGLYQSEVFPGLWLDPKALMKGDKARILDVSTQGLASPEHAAFVAKLAKKRK